MAAACHPGESREGRIISRGTGTDRNPWSCRATAPSTGRRRPARGDRRRASQSRRGQSGYPLSDASSDHCRTPCLTCRPTVARRPLVAVAGGTGATGSGGAPVFSRYKSRAKSAASHRPQELVRKDKEMGSGRAVAPHNCAHRAHAQMSGKWWNICPPKQRRRLLAPLAAARSAILGSRRTLPRRESAS